MGCSRSTMSIEVQDRRRRLSVGTVEDNTSSDIISMDSQEDDRGLLASLSEKTVLKLVESQRRKFSLCSETDYLKKDFASKALQFEGDDIDVKALGFGYSCHKGLKPEHLNQDSWSVLSVDGKFTVYGVYDGHGRRGHDVSNYVKENMPKLILRDRRFNTPEMPKMFADVFRQAQNLIAYADKMKHISARMSGTTATVVVQDHVARKLTVAHVADSTCVLGSYIDKKKSSLVGRALTRDHKPTLKDERTRIQKAGGIVVFDGYANHRVYASMGSYPGINMSRCLGDLLGHAYAGLSCEPEVMEKSIDPLDHVLLICSDGVWEFITPQEAVDKVGSEAPDQAIRTAEQLAGEAWDRWIQKGGGVVVDDITVLLVYLQSPAVTSGIVRVVSI